MNELEKNKTYVIGNYMIRMNDKGILRITSDKGVILVQPKADNSIEIKYKSFNISQRINYEKIQSVVCRS